MASGKVYQAMTAIASGFGSFVMAMLCVWPSYTTSLLTAENSTILTVPMTATEESLLGSLPSLGAILGTAMIAPLIETFGRKLGSTVVCLSYVLSWTLISVSKSSMIMLVARFLGGMGGGANMVYAPMFISEVAEDSIRGALTSVPVEFYGIGALTSYLLGWFFGYTTIVWINLACSVLSCILLMSVPESPVYLMKKNREEDARISMALYRGVSPKSMVVQEELSRIKQQISPAVESVNVDDKEKAEEPEKEKLTSGEVFEVRQPKTSAIKALLLEPVSRRAFLVVLTVMSMQVTMGIVPVQVYAKHVFKQADPAQADLYSVIFAVVMVVGCFVTGGIADKAGRRILLITSSAMVAVSMASLGFLLQTKSGPAWLTVVLILLYCFSFMSGAGTVPYVLLAESFTPEVQACASTLIIEWAWFLSFLVLGIFPWLNRVLGIYGTFYIFAVDSVANAVLCWMLVPETKGLSNQQIQDAYRGRK